MYDLSFSLEFFWDNSEYPNTTDKPTSLYEALYNLYLSDRDQFNNLVADVLKHEIKALDYLPETLIHELVEKAQEYNTCVNLNTPVEVYINEDYTVEVY